MSTTAADALTRLAAVCTGLCRSDRVISGVMAKFVHLGNQQRQDCCKETDTMCGTIERMGQ